MTIVSQTKKFTHAQTFKAFGIVQGTHETVRQAQAKSLLQSCKTLEAKLNNVNACNCGSRMQVCSLGVGVTTCCCKEPQSLRGLCWWLSQVSCEHIPSLSQAYLSLFRANFRVNQRVRHYLSLFRVCSMLAWNFIYTLFLKQFDNMLWSVLADKRFRKGENTQ